MKVNAYIAEFSTAEKDKFGEVAKIKQKGSLRLLVLDSVTNLVGMAYKRATPEQLACERIKITKEN